MCHPDWYWFLTNLTRPGQFLGKVVDLPAFPAQLKALVGVQQDLRHHPEGDAFQHTTHVVDAMAKILSREGITGDRRVTLLLAALTHDLGKAVSTKWHDEKQKWVAYGHDVTGVPLAREVLAFLQTLPEKAEVIVRLVRWHMAHTRPEFTTKAVAKLARELYPATIADLVLLLEADCAGRPPIPPGLPPAVVEQLIPIAKANGWYVDAPKGAPYLRRTERASPGPV